MGRTIGSVEVVKRRKHGTTAWKSIHMAKASVSRSRGTSEMLPRSKPWPIGPVKAMKKSPLQNDPRISLTEIRFEHEKIAKIMEDIKGASGSGDTNECKDLLFKLRIAEEIHFRREEVIMDRINYPGLAAHTIGHNEILKVLRSVIHTITTEDTRTISLAFINYLNNVKIHGERYDISLENFLRPLQF